ncbi:hypothetical protein P4V54_09425 [Brevibacillus nitrificans]|uniref:hypothetical protein n=1 Tax=Brevibacillus nitrificans TaxID=651560 RepID=UPI002E1A1297|nr:hypothetical protein [Brevibacillus nitrificans]
MKKYPVIADFIDKETGEVVKAGDVFEADDDRAEQLKEKQLIGKEVEKQAVKPKGNSATKPEASPAQPSTEKQPDEENKPAGDK